MLKGLLGFDRREVDAKPAIHQAAAHLEAVDVRGPVVRLATTRMGERKMYRFRREDRSMQRKDRSKFVRGLKIRRSGATPEGGSGV